jgi:c-di-GMP-binding flagellar brake protein YcgR
MKPDDPSGQPVAGPPQARVPSTRRRFSRIAVDLPAKYAVNELPHWNNCSIVNIGGGGVRVQTLEKVPSGTSIMLRFDFDQITVKAKARIVDSTFDRARGSFFSSAAFMSIDPGQQQSIEQRVADVRAASGP